MMNKMITKFNVIIPMAGESSRFDYNFKPFLNLDNRVFIEHVLDSFGKLDIESYNFIITEEQEKNNSIFETLKKIFPQIYNKINVVIINKKTHGPFQTIRTGLHQLNHLDNVFICDCDHYVNVDPILFKLEQKNYLDIIIPVWTIKDYEYKNWGKVIIDSKNDYIVDFCEKEKFEKTSQFYAKGVIGCYYFKSSSEILNSKKDNVNFSDFFKDNHKNYDIDLAHIESAYFFGDPKMVKKAVQDRRKKETVFCDVDGVLLKHKDCSNDFIDDNFIIGMAAEKIKKWRLKLQKKTLGR